MAGLHDTELVFELGPSSRLVRQLKSGAPFDVLLTADAAWMDEARAEVEDARVFARGRLVVIVPRGRHDRPTPPRSRSCRASRSARHRCRAVATPAPPSHTKKRRSART
ncbi:MAG: substrate-binding domain-containing protein [Sandaracinus sp.]|nr:substrate-binding domain-containing protein [Sandaracinus sp.]